MVQIFIRVDDVKAHLKKAEALGAHMVIPPQTLPKKDEMAVVVDLDGIPFAVFSGAGSVSR
jgi:predicted enzyme related to lactoylglutathione lyase